MIVFEMTGDWQTGIAVMTTVSLSSALASGMVDRSFFLTQLERRRLHLAKGPQQYLLALHRVGGVMAQPGHPDYPDEAAVAETLAAGLAVGRKATLAEAMPLFGRAARHFLVITEWPDDGGPPRVAGVLFELDALRAYARAMAATAAEEHS